MKELETFEKIIIIKVKAVVTQKNLARCKSKSRVYQNKGYHLLLYVF